MDTQSTFWTNVEGGDLLLLGEGFLSWDVSRQLGCLEVHIESGGEASRVTPVEQGG